MKLVIGLTQKKASPGFHRLGYAGRHTCHPLNKSHGNTKKLVGDHAKQ
jgi:hypothetical protein